MTAGGSQPFHLLVKPDRQRAALDKRIIVGRPVRRAVAGMQWFCHPAQLYLIDPKWNPLPIYATKPLAQGTQRGTNHCGWRRSLSAGFVMDRSLSCFIAGSRREHAPNDFRD